jgi:hypothetical protein
MLLVAVCESLKEWRLGVYSDLLCGVLIPSRIPTLFAQNEIVEPLPWNVSLLYDAKVYDASPEPIMYSESFMGNSMSGLIDLRAPNTNEVLMTQHTFISEPVC